MLRGSVGFVYPRLFESPTYRVTPFSVAHANRIREWLSGGFLLDIAAHPITGGYCRYEGVFYADSSRTFVVDEDILNRIQSAAIINSKDTLRNYAVILALAIVRAVCGPALSFLLRPRKFCNFGPNYVRLTGKKQMSQECNMTKLIVCGVSADACGTMVEAAYFLGAQQIVQQGQDLDLRMGFHIHGAPVSVLVVPETQEFQAETYAPGGLGLFGNQLDAMRETAENYVVAISKKARAAGPTDVRSLTRNNTHLQYVPEGIDSYNEHILCLPETPPPEVVVYRGVEVSPGNWSFSRADHTLDYLTITRPTNGSCY